LANLHGIDHKQLQKTNYVFRCREVYLCTILPNLSRKNFLFFNLFSFFLYLFDFINKINLSFFQKRRMNTAAARRMPHTLLPI